MFLGIYFYIEDPSLKIVSTPAFSEGTFSIQALPSNWNFLEPHKHILHKDSDVEFMSSDHNAFGMVIAETLEQPLSAETLRKLALSYPEKQLEGFTIQHEETIINTDKEAQYIIYSGSYEGKKYTYAAWYVMKDKALFQIITWSLENNFEKYLDSFQKIFNNFSLLKKS